MRRLLMFSQIHTSRLVMKELQDKVGTVEETC